MIQSKGKTTATSGMKLPLPYIVYKFNHKKNGHFMTINEKTLWYDAKLSRTK